MKIQSGIRLSSRMLLVIACGVSLAQAIDPQPGEKTPSPTAPSKVAADAPEAWGEWAKWADALHAAPGNDGHGPDIGSDEWANALDRQLKISDGDGHGPEVKSKEWRRAVEAKLLKKPAAPVKIERALLSAHETVARFVGITDHQCKGRTALCPDRCGDSGKLATFAIVKYLRYEKPGQYGDPQQEQFQVLIKDNMNHPKVPEAVLKSITALQPGELVRLAWNHDYVTREGAKFPERPIVSVATLTKEQADALPGIGGKGK